MVNWNIKGIYASTVDWEKDISTFKKKYSIFINMKKKKNEDIGDILKFLEYSYEKLDKLHTYSLLKYYEDTNNEGSNNLLQITNKLYIDFEEKTNFLQELIEENIEYIKKNENLKYYSYFYFKQEQVQVTDVQKKLSYIYDNLELDREFDSMIFNKEYLSKFKYKDDTYIVTNDNLVEYLSNVDREFRKKVFISVEENLSKDQYRAALILNSHFQIKNEIAMVGKYSCNFDENIKGNVLNLSCEYFEKLTPKVIQLYQNILELKRNTLNLDTICYYDLYVTSNYTQEQISFSQAKVIILESLKPLGNEYISIVNKIFKEEWIDYDIRKYKKSGGRSINVYGLHPFISINWNNDLESLYVLAHEIGGAIAQYISAKDSGFLYSELSVFKTEIFSFLNERLLSSHLLENSYSNIRKENIYGKIIDNLKDSFFIPFEMSVVEMNLSKLALSQKLTPKVINDVFYETVSNFHGYQHFIPSLINKYNWIRVNKLISNGYNFKYIEAFTVAFYLEKLILEEKERERVFDTLKNANYYSDQEFIDRMDLFINIEDMFKKLDDDLKEIKNGGSDV